MQKLNLNEISVDMPTPVYLAFIEHHKKINEIVEYINHKNAHEPVELPKEEKECIFCKNTFYSCFKKPCLRGLHHQFNMDVVEPKETSLRDGEKELENLADEIVDYFFNEGARVKKGDYTFVLNRLKKFQTPN